MAGAIDFGVASRANLFLVKYENFFINTKTGETEDWGVTTTAMIDATSEILKSIGDKVPEGRAVFSMSTGLCSPNLDSVVDCSN